jgi:hypothetical protein
MAEPKLFAYASQISVRPGDALDVMVAAEGVTMADAQLVRLVHGDANPAGPGYVEEEIDADCNGSIEVSVSTPSSAATQSSTTPTGGSPAQTPSR